MSSQTQFSQSDLVFRFVGGKNDGRLVPVATSKCMLGKDQNQNAKCAIYRSEKGTTVESMASDVLMNGRSFGVNWLTAGDRITVGASVLEIVQVGNCEGVVEEQVLPVDVVVSSNETSLSLDAGDGGFLSPIDSLAKEIEDQLALKDGDPSSPEASGPETEDAAERQPKFDLETSGEQPDGTGDGNISVWDLPESFSTLAKPSETSSSETPSSETPVESKTADAEPIVPAKGVTPEMEALSKRLFGAGDETAVEKSESAAEFAIETTATSLSNQLNSLMGNALKPDVDRADSSADLASSGSVPGEDDLESLVGSESLLAKYGLTDSTTGDETAPDAQGETKAPNETASASSESVADLLARMQMNTGDDDANIEAGAEAEKQDTSTIVESTSQRDAPVAVAENGDSVQDYMTGLLERLRGGVEGPAQKPENKPEPKAKKVETPVEEPVVDETPVALLTPDEFKPKARAPENAENLDAMRELANEQVRKAIFVSQMKRRKAVTLTFFCIALGGLMLAGYSILTAKGLDVSFFVGLACVAIGIGTGYKCLSTHLGWDLPSVKTKTMPVRPPGSEKRVDGDRRDGVDRREHGARSSAVEQGADTSPEVALDVEGSP